MIFTSGSCYIYRDTTNFDAANKDSPAARSAAIPAQSAQPGAIIRRNSRTARPSRCFSSRCRLAPPPAAPVSTEEREGRDRGKERRERGEKEREDQRERRERERNGERGRNQGRRGVLLSKGESVIIGTNSALTWTLLESQVPSDDLHGALAPPAGREM